MLKLEGDILTRLIKTIQIDLPYELQLFDHRGRNLQTGEVNSAAQETMRLKETTVDDWDAHRTGVIAPVRVNINVGAVEVMGAPTVVAPFVRIIVDSFEFLVQSEIEHKHEQIDSEERSIFFHQWLLLSSLDDADQHFLETARKPKIDLSRKYQIALIRIPSDETQRKQLVTILEDSPLAYLTFTHLEYIIFTENVRELDGILQQVRHHRDWQMGVGSVRASLHDSLHEAMRTILISKYLEYTDVYFYNSLVEVDELMQSNVDVRDLTETMMGLSAAPTGEELLRTFWTYAQLNGDNSLTAKTLNIHRNTLRYRLDKLSDALNVDPRNLSDYPRVYIAYLKYIRKRFIGNLI
ncbi:PucR family transcriptional regulator [Furfurilactobacillus entadae]|uniref:PucR family transcriptional regulator n=1 Tax=Furfurilactobacillus entadae TaxID=2922307 RepID=UPI0035E74D11